jgi:hypothetical protein
MTTPAPDPADAGGGGTAQAGAAAEAEGLVARGPRAGGAADVDTGEARTGGAANAAAGDAAAGDAAAGDAGAGGAGAGDADGVGGSGAPQDAAAGKREHAVRGMLAAALILEGITVLFVPQTIARIGAGGLGGTRLVLLLVLAAALFVAAGIQKRRAGLILGSALQVPVIATGLMVAAMYFLGLLFAGVWAYLLWVRQEILRAAARPGAPGGESGQPTA